MGALWPDKTLFKHTYRISMYGAFVATGTPTDQRRYGNNPYDPDPAIGGDSTYWFNTLGRVYQYFYCSGSKIRVSFLPDTITATPNTTGTIFSIQPTGAYCYVLPSVDGTQPTTDFEDLQQAGYSKTKLINRTNGEGRKYVIKHYMNNKKIIGFDPKNISNYFGTVSSSPVNLWFWFFGFRVLNPTDSLTGQTDVVITYYTTWFRRYPTTVPTV